MNRLHVLTALGATCCFAAAVHAEEREARNPLQAKVVADAGAFFMSTDTRVRVDGETSGAQGTDVDYDDTFGLGDFDRFRAEVLWRIADRHVLRAMFFQNNREATRQINQNIVFGDETFPADATVRAKSDLTVAQLSYDYAFLRRENYELAVGIGVHMLDVGLKLDATVAGASGSQLLAQDATTLAPLPVVALRGIWRVAESFYFTAQAQYFQIKYDPYDGSLTDLKATFVWQPTDHFGVGVGYNDFGFRFDLDDEGDFTGRLRWNYGGAIAFATFMF